MEILEQFPFERLADLNSMTPIDGGTSFEVIFKYLSDKLKDNLPRVVVVITDGYATFPDESVSLGVPIIWLIVDSNVKPPFGESIHIHTNK